MTSALKKLKSIPFKQHESVVKDHRPRKLSKIEDFTILEQIGKGTYSTVYKARRNDI
jgi:serine/threonine protein kinase